MESKALADACRRELAGWVRENAGEIEDDIVDRLRLLEGGSRAANGWRPNGVRKVVGPTLEYMCCAIEAKVCRQPPPQVITNTRKLAGKGFSASTLLRRYDAAESVFKEHLRRAASSVKSRSQGGLTDADRAIDCAFERLLEVVEEEHAQEEHWLNAPRNAHELKIIEQLLGGKMIYPPDDLAYDFSATHIGVVGSGPGVEGEIRRLAQMLGGETLVVQPSLNQFWAWIGLKRHSSSGRLDNVLKQEWGPAVRMGIGEPGASFPGWSRTHFQATAAFTLALKGNDPLVRYGDDPLLASAVMDDRLQTSLRDIYIEPILADPRGDALCDTLYVFFVTGRTKAAAAAALGVSRQVVSYRIQSIERLLNRPLAHIASALDVAVRLERLSRHAG